MCGVAGQVGLIDVSALDSAIARMTHRGPDAADFVIRDGIALGHTRLAILDLDHRSDQPFERGDLVLSYNGELWNYRQLRRWLEGIHGHVFETDGDTEVVAAALQQWGTEALKRMEGMFALAWTTDGEGIYVARDRFGEVPLHVGRTIWGWAFASELKALRAFDAVDSQLLPPGSWARLEQNGSVVESYYDPPIAPLDIELDEAALLLCERIADGCRERAISDVPVCTLLSGGIDSAAVAYHLREHVPDLVAFTAVLDHRSRDLRCARETAHALDLPLIEVTIPPPLPSDLNRIIHTIEMPFKAQVEIAWPCLVLAQRMRAEGFKVTFSGEGSDELWASYGFSHHGLKKQGWHEYRRDLFVGQHRKNFCRVNKAFLSSSIEARLPFLHTRVAELALGLPERAVRDGSRPKAVLQRAYEPFLPKSVVKRPKVAFQDGLGIKPYFEDITGGRQRETYREIHEAFA